MKHFLGGHLDDTLCCFLGPEVGKVVLIIELCFLYTLEYLGWWLANNLDGT